MNQSTLTLYLVAGLLSLGLSALTLGFTRLQAGTLLARHWAVGILVLAIGFIAAGFGSELPRWATVIGTNMLLLAAGVVFFDGARSFAEQAPNRIDPWNWSLLALTLVPFWYWGLVEPDGHARSAVFSFAYVFVSGRIALVLVKTSRRSPGNLAMWALALLFSVMALSMTARGFFHLLTATPPALQRGDNPTQWGTVAGFVLLATVMTVCVFWMELTHLRNVDGQEVPALRTAVSRAETSRSRLVLLWATVGAIAIGLVSELGVAYSRNMASEHARVVDLSVLTNDALAQHTKQVMGQLETTLQAVRGYHLQARSAQQTEAFIDSLHLDRNVIDKVSVADAAGHIVVAQGAAASAPSVADTDYFRYHRDHAGDALFISTVEFAPGSGAMHFAVSRRTSRPDGSFGGVVVGSVNPTAFTSYYRQLTQEMPSVVALIGTHDKKLRARTPELPQSAWAQPLISPVWNHVDEAPSGVFDAVSPVDGVRRTYAYKLVGDFPLVVVNGFSDADLLQHSGSRMQWLVLSALVVLGCVVALAFLLSNQLRRSDEQDRFMAMLSHELKTPMSVIRMALGAPTIGPAMRERVARAVDDMNAIVERCLQSDLLRSGRTRLNLETCDLHEVLQDLHAGSRQPERITLQTQPLPTVQTDRQLLQVVLANLMDNALKYSAPDSAVQVQVTQAERAGRKGAAIQVASAIGPVGAPDPAQVFKKYYRSPGAHGKTGSGLGLHIAAGFARKLRGDLSYTRDAQTVKFTLWLPL